MTIFDRNVRLNTDPHYTDERFRHAQVVFGKEEKGLEWNYSDRLSQWDYSGYMAAFEQANKSDVVFKSAEYYEIFLSQYWGKPVELVCIMAGWNWATGYAYQVFGYRLKSEEV